MKSIFFVLAVLVVSCASAQKVRPSIPKLYLSHAGLKPVTEERIPSFRNITICPADYPNGFTIRCDTITGPDFPVVVFRVRRTVHFREVREPYFLQGDNKRKVKAFRFDDFITKKRVRVACIVKKRRPVWTDIFRGCPEEEPTPTSEM